MKAKNITQNKMLREKDDYMQLCSYCRPKSDAVFFIFFQFKSSLLNLMLSTRYLCTSSDEESMHRKTSAMRRSECLYNICWLKSWFMLLFLDSKFTWNEIQMCTKMKISKASCKWKRESVTCWAYSYVKIASSVIWNAGYCSVLFGAETFKKCFSC